MRKIIDKVKNIRNKPEEDRIKIMWFLVAFFMIIAIGIGFLEFLNKKSNFEKLAVIDPSTFPAFTKTAESLKKLSEEKDNEVELLMMEAEKVEMENIAKKYVEKNNYFLKGGKFEDLKLEKIEKWNNNWYLSYRQYYKNILVEKSDGGLTIDASTKTVTSAGFDFYSDIDVESEPEIEKETAYDLIRKKIKIDNLELKSSQLVIYKDIKSGKYYLAWELVVFLDKPIYRYKCFVDAKNGDVVTCYSLIIGE